MKFEATGNVTFPAVEVDGEEKGWFLGEEIHAMSRKKVFVLSTTLRQKPKRTDSFIRQSVRIMTHDGRVWKEINSVKCGHNPSICQVTCHEYVLWKLTVNCMIYNPDVAEFSLLSSK
jgi:hypothetical protein